MAATPPKGPPKFVPTLTDVVQVSGDAVPGAAHGDAAPSATEPPPAGDARPAIPTGTPFPAPVSASAAPAATGTSADGDPIAAVPVPGPPPIPVLAAAPAEPSVPPLTAADFSGIEEMVIHRIIQRVDVVLDQRLREAIATVVQEQTRSMVPRLREEVESVVRHAVYEAVAEELAGPGGTQR